MFKEDDDDDDDDDRISFPYIPFTRRAMSTYSTIHSTRTHSLVSSLFLSLPRLLYANSHLLLTKSCDCTRRRRRKRHYIFAPAETQRCQSRSETFTQKHNYSTVTAVAAVCNVEKANALSFSRSATDAFVQFLLQSSLQKTRIKVGISDLLFASSSSSCWCCSPPLCR